MEVEQNNGLAQLETRQKLVLTFEDLKKKNKKAPKLYLFSLVFTSLKKKMF